MYFDSKKKYRHSDRVFFKQNNRHFLSTGFSTQKISHKAYQSPLDSYILKEIGRSIYTTGKQENNLHSFAKTDTASGKISCKCFYTVNTLTDNEHSANIHGKNKSITDRKLV